MIVLDTHAWLWAFAEPRRLSRRARRAIDDAVAGSRLVLSTISTWEIHMLVLRGRLELTMTPGDWVRRSEALPFVEFVAPDNGILEESVHLPGEFHADPADRIIVATARRLGLRLVTKDARIGAYDEVETIW